MPAPPRPEALRYLLGDLPARQVGREQARGGDGAGGARAVGDHHGAAEAEQPDPWRRHAERELSVGHPELAELDQHLRLGIRGRAGVDEHRAARPGRQHHGKPGRSTPGSDLSLSLAIATMPPVDPAETTAAGPDRRPVRAVRCGAQRITGGRGRG
jgi:hypothetical protein